MGLVEDLQSMLGSIIGPIGTGLGQVTSAFLGSAPSRYSSGTGLAGLIGAGFTGVQNLTYTLSGEAMVGVQNLSEDPVFKTISGYAVAVPMFVIIGLIVAGLVKLGRGAD